MKKLYDNHTRLKAGALKEFENELTMKQDEELRGIHKWMFQGEIVERYMEQYADWTKIAEAKTKAARQASTRVYEQYAPTDHTGAIPVDPVYMEPVDVKPKKTMHSVYNKLKDKIKTKVFQPIAQKITPKTKADPISEPRLRSTGAKMVII